jgi:hypothetical protein
VVVSDANHVGVPICGAFEQYPAVREIWEFR